VANVQKFAKGNVKGLSIHLDRKTLNHSNKEIDTDKSHLNYDLCEKDGDTLSRMNERLSEVHCLNRKDVKVCADWVVTLPENLKGVSENEQREFFEKTYEFLTERYGGEKNVLSANVHNDETTPHMHFAFMPVVWDEKKQREKVSAKEVLNRKDLQTFHQDLDNFLKAEIPHIYKEGILNGKTIDVENVKELKKYADEIKKQKEEMTAELKVFKEPKKVLEKVEGSAKKTLIGGKVALPPEDFEKLKDLAMSSVKAKHQLDKLKDTATDKIADLETKFQLADQRAIKAEREVRALGDKVDKLKEHQKNEIIYKSMLQDTDRDLHISETEKKGRLILYNLENGYDPKNRQEGEQWLSILEENSKAKTIPQKRLEGLIERLKAFIDKLLGKENKFSLDGLKHQKEQEQTRQKPKAKKKSMDMGR
jgi:Plasmid recombination enzyme